MYAITDKRTEQQGKLARAAGRAVVRSDWPLRGDKGGPYRIATEQSVPTATLLNGELPVIGKGTYRLDGDTARTVVSTALDTGYTHLDTAEGYCRGIADRTARAGSHE